MILLERMSILQAKTLVFFLFLLCSLIIGCGQKDKKESDVNDIKDNQKPIEGKETTEALERQEQFESLKKEAQKRFEEELQKEPKFDVEGVKRKLFLQKYGVDITQVPARKKTKEEVEKLIETLVSEATNLKFPEEKRSEIIKQAEKEFPLFNPGDLVEIRTRRGSVFGTLERIYPDKIKVEKFYILLSDIISPHWVCFNHGECIKRRDHFIRVNFDIPKDDFENKCRKEFTPNIYKEEGYIYVKDTWVGADDLIEEQLIPQVKQLEKKYNEDLAKKVRERVEQQMEVDGLFTP